MLKTADRLDMTKFPIPAYELADIRHYFLGSIQYSSGCPYQCEFCDIPGLYGRNPRLKTPQQITAELDKLLECGITGSVYFVDDNFIGNRKAALELLPHLIEWQKKTGYVLRFSCEATLNIAKRPEILAAMREAFFATIFCGIETPDPAALKAMRKDHNMMVPIMEGDPDPQRLRHGGRLRHHPRPRYRQAGDRTASARIHRRVADPAADHQSAAGVAANAAVGPAEAREPADRGRGPRFQRRFPLALRRRRDAPGAPAWGAPISPPSCWRATNIQIRAHLSEPDQASAVARAVDPGAISSSA